MKRRQHSFDLAPTETPEAPRPTERRTVVDPASSQRAWSVIGAAAGSALLATIVGPMIAAADASEMNFEIPAAGEDTTQLTGGPDQVVVYLQPGEQAPDGAPVVRLDPITVVASPRPGTATVAPAPKRKVIYVYLQPGETPPPGAIVQQAGSVAVAPNASPVPSSSAGGGAGATRPIATPAPVVNPPVVDPPIVKPPIVKPPVTTKPSG